MICLCVEIYYKAIVYYAKMGMFVVFIIVMDAKLDRIARNEFDSCPSAKHVLQFIVVTQLMIDVSVRFS
jgi:hypothetical protein